MNNLISNDFYTDALKPAKYVIYGDSVTENMVTPVMIGQTWQLLDFKEIWDLVLCHDYKITYKDDKEYIYLNMSADYFSKMNTLTYDIKSKKVCYKPVYYIMRHKINKNIYEIKSEKDMLMLTDNHSLLDIRNDKLIEIKPENAFHVWVNNEGILTKNKIKSKKQINYNGYVYDLCIPDTQNFFANNILVHNTDSVYLNVPNLKPKNIPEAIQMGDDLADKINSTLQHVMNTQILISMGIDPKYNRINFKTDMVADAIILLAAKKSYAYRKIGQEGKIIDPPEPSYTGISVKSDISKWSREFIRGIVENIVLNPEIDISQSLTTANQFAITMRDKLIEAIDNLNVSYIGIPKKWGSRFKNEEPWQVIGMRLFNTLTNSKTFTPMSPAYLLTIQIKNAIDFETKISGLRSSNEFTIGNIPISKLNYIGFPYTFDVDEIKTKLNYYGISIDFRDVWEKVYNKQANEIIKIIQLAVREYQYKSVRK